MSKLGNKASFLQGVLLVPNLVALAGAAFVVDGPIWLVVDEETGNSTTFMRLKDAKAYVQSRWEIPGE